MAKAPKPFVFELWDAEAAEVRCARPDSTEARALHRSLLGQLEDGNCIIALSDAQIGQLIRHMAIDGAPFKVSMFRAFSRHIYGLLAAHAGDRRLAS